MKRKVYLDGELGEKYGRELTINAANFSEVFKCLDCNFPDFRDYILECEEKGIGFSMEVGDDTLTDEKELLMNFQSGDMYITPQPAGADGAVKIFAAIVIAVLIIASGPTGWAWAAGGGLSTAGALAAGLAINLAMQGLAELMAPDPATDDIDQSQDKSYLFQGSGQNIEEGDPVPVVYGKLRVPARLVSFDIRNEKAAYTNGGFSAMNALNIENVYAGNAESNSTGSTSTSSILPPAPGTYAMPAPSDVIGDHIIFPAAQIHP